MSQPEPGDLRLPILFLDRRVGRVGVAAGLRAAGFEVITLAEHYGMSADERVVANRDRMARVCYNAGPFVYRIHPEHLQRLQIPR